MVHSFNQQHKYQENRNRGNSQGAQQTPNDYLQNINLKNLTKENIVIDVKNFSETLGTNEKFTSNQIRKYYNDFLAIKNKYQNNFDKNKLQLDFGIFSSKIQYGVNKAKQKEKEGFKYYQRNIDKLLSQIEDEQTFKNLQIVMEAIVAYFPKQN